MKKITLKKKDIEILEKQKQAFIEKFGREPSPNDPVFFDPDYDYPTPITPEKMMDAIVEASTKAGIDSYKALRHFQYTEEEIEAYFNKVDPKTIT